MHWEPCAENGTGLHPLPFSRWALDVVLVSSDACVGRPEHTNSLAFEIDRVLRPGGLFVSRPDTMGDVFSALEHRAGWPNAWPNVANYDGSPFSRARVRWAKRPATAGERSAEVKIKQCSQYSRISPTSTAVVYDWMLFCTVPSSPMTDCVYDSPPLCSNVRMFGTPEPPPVYNSEKLSNSAHKRVAIFWRDHAFLGCALPRSFYDLTQGEHVKYLNARSFKEVEWSQFYEGRAIAGKNLLAQPDKTTLEPPLANRVKCLNHLTDSDYYHRHGIGTELPKVMRVLDAGGGSCALPIHLQQYQDVQVPLACAAGMPAGQLV